jgi:DNA-binding transcriptional LysR family regulator
MFFSRQVHQFIITIQEGSILKASEKISITPSAISRGIAELECKIGSKLIKKTQHGIQTTEKGELIYRELLVHYNEIKAFSNELKKTINHYEIIIRTDGLYIPKMKEKILQLFMENQNINISFLSGHNDKPEDVFFDGTVDVYISTHNHSIQNLSTICMKPEVVGVITHKDIIHEHKTLKSILSKKPIIQTHSALNRDFLKGLKNKLIKEGCQVNTLLVSDVSDICYLVSEGIGISFMPQSMYHNNGLLDSIIFIEKPFDTPIYFQRNIYFKSERFNELMRVCTILGGG